MSRFDGGAAVITGAASGIGYALANACTQRGMRVLMADVEEPALLAACEELRATGADAAPFVVDVSSRESVNQMTETAYARFGTVQMLFNNAGVGGGASIWETSDADWEWILGVNLFGVIHGVRAFVPRMLAQGGPACIVNTASVAGLISGPGLGAYKVAKHGVVTLSETLSQELRMQGAPIGVHVLCPGFVNTAILTSDRNRPGGRATPPANPVDAAIREQVRQGVLAGLSPASVAEQVFAAVDSERFYILTHPEYLPAVQNRMEDILQQRAPGSAGA